MPKGKGASKNEIFKKKEGSTFLLILKIGEDVFVFILFCTVLSLIFAPELSHFNNVFFVFTQNG